ncbi:hypothetical protein [uncultured Amnibacterium sp.]|uniref:family 4 glycosyl hydrolase n=1 Tax=uncultured Amnibacterium sp. TaxID=1631851 RepID=UPI0035CB9C69
MKVALVGAGSRHFARRIINDLLLSDALTGGLDLSLMDTSSSSLPPVLEFARTRAAELHRSVTVTATDDLDSAVRGAGYVVVAVERQRYEHWAKDFVIPRKYGFRPVFGENGGPGGTFHALRQMPAVLHIARRVEALAPNALLLNFSNPESKLVELITRATGVRAVGLCGGYVEGRRAIASILQRPVAEIRFVAAGLNHFTFVTRIEDRATGEDLYPQLREKEAQLPWTYDWHAIALPRIMLRRFGLWPSPSSNHIGEYLSWAHEFVATELQFFHDPADGPIGSPAAPRPQWQYSIDRTDLTARTLPAADAFIDGAEDLSRPSSELAVPILESLETSIGHDLPAVNLPNDGAIPGLPSGTVLELPVHVASGRLQPVAFDPLPEPITAMLRTQASIQRLCVEAFLEHSKEKLLQAILIDPTIDSYSRAVYMVEEFLSAERDALPALV